MLVHFQKLCRTLNWNSLNFSLCRLTTWFRWTLEARISQKISCYLESENMHALISMCYSALQHWYFCIGRTFPRSDSCFRTLRIRVSGPPEKSISNDSLLHASGGATPWIADILANPDPFLAWIRVFGPHRHPWLMAQGEIAPPRRPKWPILNLGLLCCWRGALISVDILASTSPLRARFRVYAWKIRF